MKITIDKSYVNRGNLIFMGISLMTIGCIILYGKSHFLSIVMKIIAGAFIINGISQIISIVVRKKDNIKNNATIGHSILNLILGVGILVLPNISLSLLSIAFALYLILNGIVKLITIYIYIRNNSRVSFGTITEIIIFFVFGVTALFSPLMHLNEILVIIAIYFFLLGMNFIKDFIMEIIPKKTKNKLKRKVRITLPVFLVTLIPHKVLKEINAYFEINDNESSNNNESNNDVGYEADKSNEEDVDLEIFIHVTSDGIGVVGHVDLCYKGEVISYGNYDESSYKLHGMLGKGILFTCEKEKYINFCISYSKKTLFCYGLKLSEEQKRSVEKKLNDMKSNLVGWKPPIVFEENKKLQNEYKDYASELYKATQADFFKFKSGKFRTYFGLNNNCVILADSVIGNSGIDILGMGGIISPGTYYEYLKNEFAKRNSIVVSKTIYR